ncbi:unnamed protein product [Closterium sp. NIES-53]
MLTCSFVSLCLCGLPADSQQTVCSLCAHPSVVVTSSITSAPPVAGVPQHPSALVDDPRGLADPDSTFLSVHGVMLHAKLTSPSPSSTPSPSQSPTLSAPPPAPSPLPSSPSPHPTLLLHGFGASLFSFHRLQQHLSDRLRSPSLSFDRPAFGLSARPPPSPLPASASASASAPASASPSPSHPSPYSLAYSRDATIALAHSLLHGTLHPPQGAEGKEMPTEAGGAEAFGGGVIGEEGNEGGSKERGPGRVVLVGHSAGCLPAIEAALARPDLFSALVLIAPALVPPLLPPRTQSPPSSSPPRAADHHSAGETAAGNEGEAGLGSGEEGAGGAGGAGEGGGGGGGGARDGSSKHGGVGRLVAVTCCFASLALSRLLLLLLSLTRLAVTACTAAVAAAAVAVASMTLLLQPFFELLRSAPLPLRAVAYSNAPSTDRTASSSSSGGGGGGGGGGSSECGTALGAAGACIHLALTLTVALPFLLALHAALLLSSLSSFSASLMAALACSPHLPSALAALVLRCEPMRLMVRAVMGTVGVAAVKQAWSNPALCSPAIVDGYTKPLACRNWDRALIEFTVAATLNPNTAAKLHALNLPGACHCFPLTCFAFLSLALLSHPVPSFPSFAQLFFRAMPCITSIPLSCLCIGYIRSGCKQYFWLRSLLCKQ